MHNFAPIQCTMIREVSRKESDSCVQRQYMMIQR